MTSLFSYPKIALILLVGLFLLWLPSHSEQASAVTRIASPYGLQKQTLQVGGVTRTYLLYTPRSYRPGTPMPLLLAYHGGTSSGQQLLDYTHLDRAAEAKGFIVAFPDAIGGKTPIEHNWNDGRSTTANKGDDIGFTRAMIDTISKLRTVDARRIYATGYSNGAIMTQRLACEVSDRIAAFATMEGTMAKDLNPRCNPATPVSILMLHGTADKFVPYNGGEVVSLVKGIVISAPDTIAFWTRHDQCAAKPAVVNLPNKAPWDGTTVQAHTYSGCQGNANVQFDIIKNGGHTWAGAKPSVFLTAAAGKTTFDISANDEIWTFFQKHPRPAK